MKDMKQNRYPLALTYIYYITSLIPDFNSWLKPFTISYKTLAKHTYKIKFKKTYKYALDIR